jgi:hypothetical protein
MIAMKVKDKTAQPIQLKSELELRSEIERFSRSEFIFLLVLVAALIAESVIGWSFTDHRDSWFNFALLGLGCVVAICCAGEYWYAHRGDAIQSELDRRTEEKIVAAALETEKLRAQFSWRRLSAEQVKSFSDTLTDKAQLSISITYVGNDPESNTFAHEIGSLFKKSGWKVGFTSAGYSGEVTFGLRLPLYAPPNLDACGIARMALSAASIEFSGAEAPTWFMGAGSGDSITGPCAHLYVGPKPIPSAESGYEANQSMSPEEAEKVTERWRSRMQGNEPVMTWPIDAPLTITREDDGTLNVDCRNFRIAGMSEAGIARFRISPDAAKALSQYFLSLEKPGNGKQ